MLREITMLHQRSDEHRRRWFQDGTSDLCIWFDPQGRVSQFDYSYDKTGAEKLLRWKRDEAGADGSLTHSRVQAGEDDARFSRSPILEGSAGEFDAAALAKQLRKKDRKSVV